MNPEMWEKLKAYLKRNSNDFDTMNLVLEQMGKIEHRHLSERVAEILENAQYCDEWHSPTLLPKIAKALRMGDTTEIEKWVKE